ncbi:DUF456 domain-containing protein [Myroides guanonis]|uniref:DUF456 domain-containing protein n=1 Tax=Myroides guanonis TaxID=1150112 RepID=A0A1I3SH12_9FLAO|nr:DUF456 domain-containing protein [Myroides guanonis]SFJ56757.1 hypothetical protein SAMN04487893_11042 [Myroides guanonis]
MEYILLILSLILMITGILGSFLPVLPGPPISWVGLLCIFLIKDIPYNYWLLGITLVITITISVLDYLIPAQGTKKFGGSKYGIWGTNIGLIVGLIAPIPLGFLIGPFVGALIGELLFDRGNLTRALKAATGSIIGFLVSTFMKFVVTICFLGLLVQQIISYWHIWF